MAAARASSLALVRTLEEPIPPASDRVGSDADGRERRAHARLDPTVLPDPLIARVKYGDSVRLVDVSVGGALIETSAALRPDSTLVLEMTPAGAQDPMSVVARVLRCQVASVNGGIRYRGACSFKRPLEYAPLVEPAAVVAPAVPSLDAFARPEFALKAIVEGYRRRVKSPALPGPRPDPSAVLDSLRKLHESTEQRIDPIDRRVAQMLGAVVPALQRNDSPDAVMGEVLVQLARHVPAMTIRVGSGSRSASPGDAERITLNVWSEPADRATLTAEFPSGFDIDEEHFRVLKAGAYLLGLAESWTPAPPALVAVPPPAPAVEDDRAAEEEPLPAGWQRIVIRFADGDLLRGYSNNFHPDNAHLHLSPALDSEPRDRLLVPIARLKAVFFVRNLAGNAEYVDSNTFDHNPRARKLEVTFRDGEVMAGSTLNYKPDGQGFFLMPANSRGNNQRVYVVLAAVRHLRFL